MGKSQHKLLETELEAVLRTELTQRIRDELQGEAEEAPSIIREYKAKILLACKDHSLARRFFALLEWECKKIDFTKIYLAGKNSAANGEAMNAGFYRCMRELAMESENRALDEELLTVFTRLTKQMPNEDTALYPWYLLEEYRKTYGMVNNRADEFFQMGYDAFSAQKVAAKR